MNPKRHIYSHKIQYDFHKHNIYRLPAKGYNINNADHAFSRALTPAHIHPHIHIKNKSTHYCIVYIQVHRFQQMYSHPQAQMQRAFLHIYTFIYTNPQAHKIFTVFVWSMLI